MILIGIRFGYEYETKQTTRLRIVAVGNMRDGMQLQLLSFFADPTRPE